VSRNTVRNQVAAIYGKVNVHRRSALIVWARERGVRGGSRDRSRAGERKAK
jgi:DNA-binding CsgD family transcriptional regulator